MRRTVNTPERPSGVRGFSVEPAGGDWLVTGGAATHRVTEQQGQYDCDCADRAIRRGGCKHILAVLLAGGHPTVIRALRSIVVGE